VLSQAFVVEEIEQVCRDDKNFFGSNERFLQRRGVIKICLPDRNAASYQLREPFGVSRRCDDTCGLNFVAFEQMV
jgi:hypothetical protein